MADEGSSKEKAIIDLFTTYQKQLDTKYDKHERLVKRSRDCTILSKRIIFLLHRISSTKSDKLKINGIIAEAEVKLREASLLLKQIAVELEAEDPMRFHTAYSSGVQEFIEALCFYFFQKESRMVSLEEAREWLTFPQEDKQKADESQASAGSASVVFPLSPVDYALGVADFTGELMRLSINAAGAGDLELPFSVVHVLRDIYYCLLCLCPFGIKELPRKVHTLKNSLYKIEFVCYNIKMRGSEMPNHMLVDIMDFVEEHN